MTGMKVSELHAERYYLAALVPALQSALLFFFTLFPLSFMCLIFHEGGHALAEVIGGGTIDLFYVHPFSLNGYIRPVSDWGNIGMHVAGGISGLVAALVIFILVWKHRSVSTLPLVMLFPWTAILLGMELMMVIGDWRNLVRLTEMPEAILNITGGLILLMGILLFVSLFPLLGLTPEHKRSLIVLPAAIIFWSVIGIIVGYLFVSGSPVDVKYGLAEEILTSVKNTTQTGAVVGVLLAGIYVTLYRLAYRWLPASLRTETARLTWSELIIPGLIAAVCVIFGLWAIR